MTAIADFIYDLRSNIYVLGLTFGDIRKKKDFSSKLKGPPRFKFDKFAQLGRRDLKIGLR